MVVVCFPEINFSGTHLLRLCMLIIGMFVMVPAYSVEIIAAKNLQEESQTAIHQGKIYLLYISRPECPYCEKLKREVLYPLLKGQRYADKLELRELSWLGENYVDFNGEKVNGDKIVARYGVVGTPTLLFLNDKGQQYSEKLSGYFSRDFYWSYLDGAINHALIEVMRLQNSELIH